MRKHTTFPCCRERIKLTVRCVHTAQVQLSTRGFVERSCPKHGPTFATCDILYMYSKQPDDMNCADVPFLCAAANASTQPSVAFTYGPGATLVESPRIASNLRGSSRHRNYSRAHSLPAGGGPALRVGQLVITASQKVRAVPENYRGTQ